MDANCLCVDCGKYYRNPNSLRVHRKTHTGLCPFTCDVCNKSFGSKDVLGEHLKAGPRLSTFHFSKSFQKPSTAGPLWDILFLHNLGVIAPGDTNACCISNIKLKRYIAKVPWKQYKSPKCYYDAHRSL